MDVTFRYRFNSDKAISEITSDVGVTAVLEAPNLWSKTFNLLSTTKGGDFTVSFPLDVASKPPPPHKSE